MKRKSANQSAFFNLRVLIAVVFLFGAAGLLFFASAQPNVGKSATSAIYRGIAPISHFDVSPPLRDIKPLPVGTIKLRENEDRDIVPRVLRAIFEKDPVVQSKLGPLKWLGDQLNTPIVSANFNSVSGSASPPDPNGDVGPNHVVVMSNVSFQIFNKTGTSLFGPAANNTLWAGFGGACQTQNAGDPVVVYDQFADRWVLSQFTSAADAMGFWYNCVAVSQTGDPTGAYYRYAVSTGNSFPDYPKLGVGRDAYFISTREFVGGTGGPFGGVGAYALNRAQAIAGNPAAQVISFIMPPSGGGANVGDGLLPADVDGNTLPPNNGDHWYMGSMDNNGPYGAALDALTLYKFHVDFATPGNSSFVLANTLPTAPFNSILGLCGGSRACIPQMGGANIDHLGYRQRPTFRLAYRNFGDHESLVTNQSVSAGTGPSGEVAGIRWWEVRSPGSSPVIFQEGTFAPGLTDGIHRWMGSIAMDGMGNMGLGYSASNSSMFPGIRVTGRNAGSPAGTMPLGEATVSTSSVAATPLGNRWGDYTSMSVDPTDDSTFWYVNEYFPASGGTWVLRVGSFKLVPSPALAADTGSLVAEGCSPNNGTVDPGETVTVNLCVKNNGDLATTNAVGTLQNSGGVTSASGPQTFGAIAPGATVCKQFTFTASGACGSTITASLQLQDGATNLGTLTYSYVMSGTVTATLTQNFDGVVAPALPAGWTADQGTNVAGAPLWVTSNSGTPTPVADSAPNAAFTQDPANLLDNRLYSPVVMYTAGAQLTFRQNFDIEEQSATIAYDAGVLEISINGAAYQDIVTAGGSFASGGYNHTGINTGFANPLLPTRPCWSGVSGGFVSVAVNLPAGGVGQNAQFRWRLGSDNSVSHTGWRVDNVVLGQRVCATNCTAPAATSVVSRKTHGAAGDFNIPLPLTGTAGIECRSGGATNDYQIVATFGAAVTVSGSPQASVAAGSATIGSGGVANGGAVTVSGNTVTIPLTNATNAQTILVSLNGVSDGASDSPDATGNLLIPMSRLLGDTNANGAVNSTDATQTKARIGQALTTANFRSDVNASGGINSTDATVVKTNIGTGLP